MQDARAKLPNHKIEAQPLWEYPCKALAKPQELLNVDFHNFKREQSTNGDIRTERYDFYSGRLRDVLKVYFHFVVMEHATGSHYGWNGISMED